jgi:hypothetical protein
MADTDPQANSGFPDSTTVEERLPEIICPHVHSIVSRLYEQGKFSAEQISKQFWDLVDMIRHINAQDENDHPAHSASLADYPRNDESENHLPILSEQPSSGNQDWESWTPLSDLFPNLLSSCSTDDNSRWPLETPLNEPPFPSNANNPRPTHPHDGTCKSLDSIPLPDLHDLRSTTNAPEPEQSFKTGQRGYSCIEGMEGGEKEEEITGGRGRRKAGDFPTQADGIGGSHEAQPNNPNSQSPVAVVFNASSPGRDNTLDTPHDTAFKASQAESDGKGASSNTTGGNLDISKADNLSVLKQPKRKSSDIGTDMRTPKSRRWKARQKSSLASKVTSEDQHRTNVPQELESFSDLTQISQKVLEPNNVYDILGQLTNEKYHHQLDFLTRLFFAIASPHAFRQLTDACTIVRQHHESADLYPVNDDSMLMKALDVLDAGTAVRAILRRFYLVRLLDRRVQREDYYKERRSSRVRAQRKQDHNSIKQLTEDLDSLSEDRSTGRQRPGRADTNAFADLLATFYPNLKQSGRPGHLAEDREYRESYWKLKNRLKSARNWYLLQQKFSIGILALVPCGEFQIGADKYALLSSMN